MAARQRQVRQNRAQLEAHRAHGRRRRVVDIYGARIFEAGLAARPINPYFITSTNVRRKRELYIPMNLVQRTDVDIPEMTVLVDQHRREFQLRRIEWNGGRLLYVDGWLDFCAANHVEERDLVIVELVPETDGNTELHAVIIRANYLYF